MVDFGGNDTVVKNVIVDCPDVSGNGNGGRSAEPPALGFHDAPRNCFISTAAKSPSTPTFPISTARQSELKPGMLLLCAYKSMQSNEP